MNKVSLHRDNVEAIQAFIAKYPDSDYLTITVDSSSGIGSIVKVMIPAVVNGDMVEISKTLVDESGW